MGWKSLIVIIISSFLLAACSASATPTPGPAATTAPPAPTSGIPNPDGNTTNGPSPTTAPATNGPATGGNAGSSPIPTSPPDAALGSLQTLAENADATQGGTLVLLHSDPNTLDPHLAFDSTSSTFVSEIFGGLVTLDLDLNVVPDLAESIDINPDGTVYTFHLRRDATFHDGKTVTTQDVKWSLERATDAATEAGVARQYLADIVGVNEKLDGEATSIQGVQVIDEHTIEITIDAPKAYFLSKLTYPVAFVLDQNNVEGNPNWLTEPNGTGPFQLAEYEEGRTLRLTRHNGYHLGPPHLDEIQFDLRGGDAMTMYINDEIHYTDIGLNNLDQVLDPNSPLNAQLEDAPADFTVSYIGMNVTQPPLDDPKVRQALNLAIDKEFIATQILQNRVRPAEGVIPPGFPAYNPDLQGYEYNPERARQLLRESKYGDNLEDLPEIKLNFPGAFGAGTPLYLDIILQSWEEELGITVTRESADYRTFLKDLHDRRFQMFTVAWIADYPDPENFLDVLFHSNSDNNHTGYSDSEVDALLEQARVEQDQEKRFETYSTIEQMIVDDAPWVPLWHSSESYALIKPEVKNYFLTPITVPKYRYVYIEEN